MAASTRHDTTDRGCRQQPDATLTAVLEYLSSGQGDGRAQGSGDAGAVEQIETHLSHVFLCGDLVFKLLKPVKFAFVDFSTVDRRRDECRAEVELNRALAADVYLSAEPVWRLASGGVRIGGDRAADGAIVDWAVKMRRLPADRTLDALVRRGEATADHVADLAATLCEFYASATRSTLTAIEYVAAVEHHVRDNFAELSRGEHSIPTCTVARVHAAQLTTLAICRSWFHERVEKNRVVEGHGDLRPEHVYFMPRPTAIDCLAFSRELRTLDAADEVAFLAMELQRMGACDLATAFVGKYERISGDRPPAGLWDFYRAYRACVRAKVAVLRAGQLDEPQRAAERAAALEYLELADQQSRRLQRPLCIIVRGLSGTGKSTLAAALAEKLGATHLQTDRVRRQFFPGATPATYGQGCYTTAARGMVYDAMLAQAREFLAQRIPVVLDGTFLAARSRMSVGDATRNGATAVMLVCRCPMEVAARRIADRAAETQSEEHAASDASEVTLRRQTTDEEPDGTSQASTAIDTTLPIELQIEAAVDAIRSAASRCV
ncbi:MAG: AAA family ATPase [Pirellulales bacterium]